MQASTATAYARRSFTCAAGADCGSGSVRWIPSGPTSNTQASTIAIGKPTIRKTTMNVIAHSGTRSAGSTTEQASVTAHAIAP